MRRRWWLTALAVMWLAPAAAWADSLADHLLVVYNENTATSKELAGFYARVRSIPAERVLGINCPRNEIISRDEYENLVRGPINAYLESKGWIARQQQTVNLGGRDYDVRAAVRNDIWAIVLMKGIPLGITGSPPVKGPDGKPQPVPAMAREEAAIDSELALLPLEGMPTKGTVPNPYAQDTARGPRPFGAADALRMVLVTRLDAPSGSVVMRMIQDSQQAEQRRLAGWAVIDQRGIQKPENAYHVGDQWLGQAAAALFRAGWLVEMDRNPHVIAPDVPLSGVAFYAGWYTRSSEGPFFQGPRRFVPGAVAYHLHSFSASSLREMESPKRGWVGPLLAAGAAASMGCVFEPYLGFTPQVGIFTERLLGGLSFAESAYASQPVLSWMTTMVGDPLYRPFAVPLDQALAAAAKNRWPNAPWLALEKTRASMAASGSAVSAAQLDALVRQAGGTPQAWESLGDMFLSNAASNTGALEVAVQAYDKAMAGYADQIAAIRAGKKKAVALDRLGRRPQAELVVAGLRSRYPHLAALTGLNPPPPPAEPANAVDAAARNAQVADPTAPTTRPLPPPGSLKTSKDVNSYLKSLIPQPKKP